MEATIQGVLFVVGIMLGSAGGLALLWYIFFVPLPPPPKIITMDQAEFIARLRAENPPWVGIAILNAFSKKEKRYRFHFRTGDATPTLCETTMTHIPPQYAPRFCLTPQEPLFSRLYAAARWMNECTEHCGWCGTCMHVHVHEGSVDDPVAVIGKEDRPDPGAIKPFLPPK